MNPVNRFPVLVDPWIRAELVVTISAESPPDDSTKGLLLCVSATAWSTLDYIMIDYGVTVVWMVTLSTVQRHNPSARHNITLAEW